MKTLKQKIEHYLQHSCFIQTLLYGEVEDAVDSLYNFINRILADDKEKKEELK